MNLMRAAVCCARVIVLDNLKEGALTPDVYDPALNSLQRDVLSYYGVVALPCRVSHAAPDLDFLVTAPSGAPTVR